MASTYQHHSTNNKPEKTILDQHRALAEQIDIVCRALGKAPLDARQVTVALQELLKVTKAHFEHEENIMAINNFPGRLNHERDHAYLLQGLRDFISSIVDETIPVTPAFDAYLRSWLIYHVKKYDDTLQEFITKG